MTVEVCPAHATTASIPAQRSAGRFCVILSLTPSNLFTSEKPAMLSIRKPTKFCWICGTDVALEHCIIDEHGLSVHQSCHEKRMLLKAISAETESWKQGKAKRQAA